MPSETVEKLLAGDKRSLSRILTWVENGTTDGREAMRDLFSHTGQAHIIGITGPTGSGKSTLTGAIARAYRKAGKTIAIVAVDPTSPFTQGAILGDRIRMQDLTSDPGVFIRSMATRGALGGLAAATNEVVSVMDASGKDIVLVETVGAGQDEVEVAETAHTTIVVNIPGAGDDMQAIKAGILEIADAFVVNKADLPDAARTERELRAMLALRTGVAPGAQPPVLKTVATTGEGVAALADWLIARGRQAPPRAARGSPPASDAAALLERLFARDAFARHLGLELLEAGEGRAAVRMRVGPEHVNFWGSCHGGAIFSLADTALGLACNSHGSIAALIDSHMTFSVAVKAGERLTARAEEISRTRKLGVYRMEVRREDGVLVATLTGTVYRTGKPLPGEA